MDAKAKVLTRAEVLEADDLEIEAVDCPEWGGTVLIRSLGGTERDRFEQEMLELKGKQQSQMENIRSAMLARTACDAEGKLLFSDADIKALGRKNARPLDRCFGVAQRLSGLGEKDIEDLAKNLPGDPSDDSTTR